MNYPTNAIILDNSTLERLDTCPKSFYYYHERKREGSEDRWALVVGKVIHEALALRYVDPNPDDVARLEPLMLRRVEELFAEHDVPAEDYRTPLYVQDIIRLYNKSYAVDRRRIWWYNGAPQVEVPFAVPLGEVNSIPVIWTGRIDRITWMLGQPESDLWVVDTKSTTQMGGTFFDQFTMHGGLKGYCFFVHAATGIWPKGVIIDGIALRKWSVKGKGPECLDMQIPYTNLPDQVAEWRRDTLRKIETMLHYRATGHWPMQTSWCFGKYGRCPYYAIDSVPESQREMVLESGLYKPVTWSPLT